MCSWKVYLLRCSDNSLYCGIAKDIRMRINKHNEGKGAKYTRSRRPVKLTSVSNEMTKSEALAFEYYIKQLPANKKIDAFTEVNYRMKNIQIGLRFLLKDIKRIHAKLEHIIEFILNEDQK